MIDIETKNLRETFYKFFFTGYKAFVTGNMKFGVYIPEDTIEKYAYENPYNIILMKYGLISKNGKLEIKGETVKPYLGLSNNLRFSDEQLANSADCFFKICSTVSAKNHIYNLLSYNIDG